MYQVGQQVVYSVHGVCRIIGLEDRVVDRKHISYFVLQPRDSLGARYYIPSENENALSKIRPLIDKQSLLELLSSQAVQEDCWIADENRRKQYYRQLISSADMEKMFSMIHSIRRQRDLLAQAGRRLHLCDDNFLRDAQKILGSELSVVLEVPESTLESYLHTLQPQL